MRTTELLLLDCIVSRRVRFLYRLMRTRSCSSPCSQIVAHVDGSAAPHDLSQAVAL